jgi:hypothetical protein
MLTLTGICECHTNDVLVRIFRIPSPGERVREEFVALDGHILGVYPTAGSIENIQRINDKLPIWQPYRTP